MNRILCFLLLFLSWGASSAQEVVFSVLSSESNSLLIKATFPDIDTVPVSVDGEKMYRILMQGASPVGAAGEPELLVAARSIMIPDTSSPLFEIIDSEATYITGFELAPSKGRLYRNVNPDTIPYRKGPAYHEDLSFPSRQISLSTPYTLRDLHGVAISCYPYAYQPLSKLLTVYRSITFRVTFNTKSATGKTKGIQREFQDIYQEHFINYKSSKYIPLTEEGHLLIISAGEFMDEMLPLAKWKTENGLPVKIVDIETIGNSPEKIKAYIAEEYQKYPLVHVLLVGDDRWVSPYYDYTDELGRYAADNYYAEVVGADYYPDIFLGRLSAETKEQVKVQVQKIIEYESDPVETAHFPIYCGIASREGPGDNKEFDYQHIRKIGQALEKFTYTSGYELFEGSQGGNDAPGNPTANMLKECINQGVGIINYCGHGYNYGFGTTEFTSYNVYQLQNYHKLPFIIAVACLTGDYINTTCFAETWLRATKDGKPTGAVAAAMSSIIQAWNPPMSGQDEMIRILTSTTGDDSKWTFGGIVFNGILKMLDIYKDVETSRTWLLFGDPSLRVRTAIPQALPMLHDTVLHVSMKDVLIASPVEGARVVLRYNDKVIANEKINRGYINPDLPPVNIQDTIYLLASAFNYKPYHGRITFSNNPDLLKPAGNREISVYPNPVNDYLDIRSKNFDRIDRTAYLYDINGKLLQEKRLTKQKEVLDMTTYTQGVFILKVRVDEEEIKTMKVIKVNH